MIRLFFCFIFLCLCSCSQNNNVADFKLPVWEGCADVISNYDEQNNRKIIYCSSSIELPSNNLVGFYKEAFENSNLKKYFADGYGEGVWEKFNYETGEWEQNLESPGRYIETWVDPDKRVRIVLSIRYDYAKSKKEGKDWVDINLSAQPFFEF